MIKQIDFFSAKNRRDHLLICLLLLSYFGLIFAIPIPNIFDFKAAKLIFSLGFLVPALVIFFYLKLIRETVPEIFIPFIFKVFFLYALHLFIVSILNLDQSYNPFYDLAHLAITGLLLIAVYNLINSFERLKAVVFFMAVVAGIVSVLGILEYFGLVFYGLNFDSGQNIKVTFGNQNYLGGYLCITLPFLLTVFFCSEKKILKFSFLLLSILAVCAAVFTGARMTFLVIFFSLAAYLLLAFLFVFGSDENNPHKRQQKKIVIIGAFIAAIAVIVTYLIVSDAHLIQQFKTLGEDPAVFFGVRVDMYRTAVAIWLDSTVSFLFGHGCDSYTKLNFMEFPPWSDYSALRSFDQVHNEILETLVAGGILSLALYAVINLSTLYILYNIAANNTLNRDKRLIAISLAVSILAFQVHGLASISTRVLTGVYTFSWILALAWALFFITADKKEKGVFIFKHQIIRGINIIRVLGVSALLLLLLSGTKLGSFVTGEIFLTKARLTENTKQKEHYFQKSIEADKNIQAHYFLAHLYLLRGDARNFQIMADRTEDIIPRFRNINYLRAFMAAIEGEYDRSEKLFEYYDKDIDRDAPLTMLWLTVLNNRRGNYAGALDFLQQYLVFEFKRGYNWEFVKGNEIIFNKGKEGSNNEVRVGIERLGDVIKNIPVHEKNLLKNCYILLEELAAIFEDIDLGLWLVLKSQTATKADFPLIAGKIREEILTTRARYEESHQRKELRSLISLYEGLANYVPWHEKIGIRKKLLPLYLKDRQFKRYAFWKQWLES